MSEAQAIAAIDHYSSKATQFPKPRPLSTFAQLSTAASNLLSSAQNAKTGTFVFMVTLHDLRSAESSSRTIGVFNDRNVAKGALEKVLREKKYESARIWRRDIDGAVEVRKGHVHDVVGVVGRMVVKD
ncbi:hypothetical protein CLAFUW4_02269 [Fulvia fulva]|uniref:Uncharacterized protein n=1 Tax=Passalora fulva TaxID=5499 RepID=A0A9Q8P3V4_PASFU|nr:uncharacterized protein CLAFUR5_02260 [Fulvia fulva]KAK4634140.1 hypothetical protein CLAFUR4_02264 [Fulvia fulva]KAK4636570.1 hypothetical protein CLAFUR0_02268 [Fulvia fulva]UJO12209.1 hypothetical protein CLAFUR5_02260 [Fulvia fulva]WPV08149.1 hypothetical protein CLAFUW4_02269 [Fulvia fulva]WPV24273.1 hypothetical protein CLAFUW7_02269 [Fulvia fulva]